jgi:hypothetical protein
LQPAITAYARIVNRAGTPAGTRSEPKERTMSSISRSQSSDAGVVYATERSAAHGQDVTRQDTDWEDRRWQLEWARRNVED